MVWWVCWCGVEGLWDNFLDFVEKLWDEEVVVGDVRIVVI